MIDPTVFDRRIALAVGCALAIVVAMLNGACGDERDNAGRDRARSEPVQVVATAFATGDLVRQVGGKFVEVAWVVESGGLLSTSDPGAGVRAMLPRAQLVIAGSSATEPWATDDPSGPLGTQRVFRLDSLAAQAEASDSGLPWLDPVIGLMAADAVARRLAVERPEQQATFTSNAERFKDSLRVVIEEYAPRFARLRRRRVMASSHDFDALFARYGVVASYPLGDSPPSHGFDNDDLRRLREWSSRENLTLLVVRADAPRAMLEDVARRTGLTIVPLDPYGSVSADGRSTYQALMRFNLQNLLEALTKINDGG